MRRRLLVWGAIWLGWTALALFFGTSLWLNYIARGQPAHFVPSLLVALSEWWIWALLTPAVIWLTRRWPIARPRLARRVLLHLAAGIGAAALKVLLERIVRSWIFGAAPYLLPSSLALHFLVYWGIVALTMAEGYYRRSRARETQAAQIEARLHEARLQLLQAQLQPHFLFNALNTIAETVHEDPEAADRMIAALGDLLRATLDADSPTVPLAEDVDLARKFLAIQQARFGDRLAVEIAVSPDCLAARVPRLILQPLLENAVLHGAGRREGPARIRVAVDRDGQTLRVSVADNGPGLDTDAMPLDGIGLGNTRARLQAIYGSRAALAIASTRDGTTVQLTIPIAS